MSIGNPIKQTENSLKSVRWVIPVVCGVKDLCNRPMSYEQRVEQ